MGHAKLEMPLDIQAVMSNRWFCIGVQSPVGDINLGPRKIRATKNSGSQDCTQPPRGASRWRLQQGTEQRSRKQRENHECETTKARRRESLKDLGELKNMSKDAGGSSKMGTGD